MRNIFSYSFSTGLRQWRMAAVVYGIQFCLALTLGMQVHGVLQSSIGHSLEISKLLAHYDHTVFTDFLKVHGASITPLIGQLRWLLLVWLLFSVFINAGLLTCAASPEQTSARAFWTGGYEFFFPFLKIALVFLLLAVVATALIWIPVMMSLESWLQDFPSEKYAVWLVLALLAVYLTGLVKLYIWSVVSRLVHLKTGASVGASLNIGRRIFGNKKWSLLGWVAGCLGFQSLLLLLYWMLEKATGMTSSSMILVFFIVQQAFVFFRIQVRQMMYTGVGILTKDSIGG